MRTIVVGGAGAPLVNGANFFNAVIGIPAPGPANRWLVKLEPGTYDIGVLTLVLRDYVDIEGSGPWRDGTFIDPGRGSHGHRLRHRNRLRRLRLERVRAGRGALPSCAS